MDIICSSAMCSVMKTFYTADGDRDTKDSLLKFVAQVRIGVMHCVHNFLILTLKADEIDGSLTPSRGKASATPLYPEVDQNTPSLLLTWLKCVF